MEVIEMIFMTVAIVFAIFSIVAGSIMMIDYLIENLGERRLNRELRKDIKFIKKLNRKKQKLKDECCFVFLYEDKQRVDDNAFLRFEILDQILKIESVKNFAEFIKKDDIDDLHKLTRRQSTELENSLKLLKKIIENNNSRAPKKEPRHCPAYSCFDTEPYQSLFEYKINRI